MTRGSVPRIAVVLCAVVGAGCELSGRYGTSADAATSDAAVSQPTGDAAARAQDAGDAAAPRPPDAALAHDAGPEHAPDSGEDASDPDDAGPGEPTVRGLPVSEFFAGTCGGCHGRHREGNVGPTLIPSRLERPKAFYVDTITHGRPGTLMPAWGTLLEPEEIATLVDFVFTEPALDSVVWELDEIQKSHHVLVEQAALPSAPTHGGNLDDLMLVTERESRSFAVIDGDTHTLLGHVASSYRSHGYAFHPTNERWVYNLGRDGWVFKVDLYGLVPVRSVRVGIDSRGIAISDDGKYVIAGNYWPNTAVILDASTLLPIKVIHAEGVSCDGEQVKSRVGIVSDTAPALVGPYFILGLEDACQVWRVDWSKPDFPIAVVRGAGHALHDGFLSSDNRRFFIAAQQDGWMAVIDVPSWKLVDVVPTGMSPHPGSGAVWRVGDVEYGATVHLAEGKVTIWDVATGNLAGSVATPGPGLFIRSHQASPYVWADAAFADPAHAITVFDGRSPTFDVVATLTDGTQTLHPEFTTDGKLVYVADWAENVVRVYDAQYDAVNATFPLVATIDGIDAPTGIFCSGRRHETLGH